MFCINRFEVECLERKKECVCFVCSARHSAESQHNCTGIYKKVVFVNFVDYLLLASVMKMPYFHGMFA